jgi:hypothetical protein
LGAAVAQPVCHRSACELLTVAAIQC